MTTGPLATRCGARSLPRPAGIEGVRTWVTALVVRAGRFPVWVAAGWVWCGSMALLPGRLGLVRAQPRWRRLSVRPVRVLQVLQDDQCLPSDNHRESGYEA